MATIFLNLNLVAALCGWLAFNFLLLSLYKDENEKTFNLVAYAGEHWDNWIASLLFIPVLLFMGYKGLGLGVIGLDHLQWSDTYYLCAGIAPELVKEAWKRYKNKSDKQ